MAKNHRMIEIAMNILDYVSLMPDGCTFSEIWESQSIPKSTAYSIIQTLKNMKFFNYDTKTERYTLGTAAFEIGSRYITNNNDSAIYEEIVSEISRACDETVHLGILDERYVLYISKHDSNHVVRMISSIGKRVPAHGTALGKALLSGLSDDEILKLYDGITLEKLTDNTITNVEDLLKQIDVIRKTGISYESEESTLGIMCYAVPIFGKDKKVIMGVSVSIPIFRAEGRQEQILETLSSSKKKLEELCATKAAFCAR